MKEFDIHIATEAEDSVLWKHLIEAGYTDDELTRQKPMFDDKTGQFYLSCPAQVLHMSKKLTDESHARNEVAKLKEIISRTSVPGYYHAEYTVLDVTVTPKDPMFSILPLPIEYIESRPRAENKTWDLHISFDSELLSEEQRNALIDLGLYYISRKKERDGSTRTYDILTMQGTNSTLQGKHLFYVLLNWLIECGGPSFDMKLEVTSHMGRFNNPQLVPPTTNKDWVDKNTP